MLTAVCLSGLNLTVRRGEIVAIVGQIGAGKTALLNGLLGELHKVGNKKRQTDRLTCNLSRGIEKM